MEDARERLILALDFPSASRCFGFLQAFPSEHKPRWVKVGLELFAAEGPALVRRLREDGYQIFLDLKLHDIPNTVAGAVRSVAPLGASLLTVHAGGGSAMLQAAAEAAGSRIRLSAVTVLTSMDAGALQEIGIAAAPEDQVFTLAQLAFRAGIPSLVCSPRECSRLHAGFPQMHLVTPGIRPVNAVSGDQARTATPAQALRAGASQIVIGRPITAAADPVRAYLDILADMPADVLVDVPIDMEKPGP